MIHVCSIWSGTDITPDLVVGGTFLSKIYCMINSLQRHHNEYHPSPSISRKAKRDPYQINIDGIHHV